MTPPIVRHPVAPRPDLGRTAKATGFAEQLHHFDGSPYWWEEACYVLDRRRAEIDIADATADLTAMCEAVMERAVADDEVLASLGVPPPHWDALAASWRRKDPYWAMRFDLAYDGDGPARLLECNADTPGLLFESGLFQWLWLEEMLEQGRPLPGDDQFNRIHEALLAMLGRHRADAPLLHVTASERDIDDRLTSRYVFDCALQAGRAARRVDIEQVGVCGEGRLVDADDVVISAMLKLYRWEILLQEEFAPSLFREPLTIAAPLWTLALSSKGILHWLWRLFPRHPNLLPTWIGGHGAASSRYVVKPLLSHRGQGVQLVEGGNANVTDNRAGMVIQEAARTLKSRRRSGADAYAVVGSWVIEGEPVGVGIVESDHPVLVDRHIRFVPHLLAG